MAKPGETALTPEQMQRVIRAYILGAGTAATETGAQQAVDWATDVAVKASVLDLIYSGEAVIRFEPDHDDYRVRRTTEPERLYIMDQTGDDDEPDSDSTPAIRPADRTRIVTASQLPRRSDRSLRARRR